MNTVNPRKCPITGNLLRFDVLSTDLILAEDRERLLVDIAQFKTGSQAKAQAYAKGYAYEILDHRGRVGVLKWHGIEVALLFERSVHTLDSVPFDKTPGVILQDLKDAWVLVNLLDNDGLSLEDSARAQLHKVKGDVQRLQALNVAMQIELEQAQHTLATTAASMKQAKADKEKLDKELLACKKLLAKHKIAAPISAAPAKKPVAVVKAAAKKKPAAKVVKKPAVKKVVKKARGSR